MCKPCSGDSFSRNNTIDSTKKYYGFSCDRIPTTQQWNHKYRDGETACSRVLNGFIWPLGLSLLILHELIWTNTTYLTTNSCKNVSIYRPLANDSLLLLPHSVNNHINYILWTLFPDQRLIENKGEVHKKCHISCDQTADYGAQSEFSSQCICAHVFPHSWCKHTFASVQLAGTIPINFPMMSFWSATFK